MTSKATEMEWQEIKFVLYTDEKRHLKLSKAEHENFIAYYFYSSFYEGHIAFLIINNVTFTLKIITDSELLKFMYKTIKG